MCCSCILGAFTRQQGRSVPPRAPYPTLPLRLVPQEDKEAASRCQWEKADRLREKNTIGLYISARSRRREARFAERAARKEAKLSRLCLSRREANSPGLLERRGTAKSHPSSSMRGAQWERGRAARGGRANNLQQPSAAAEEGMLRTACQVPGGASSSSSAGRARLAGGGAARSASSAVSERSPKTSAREPARARRLLATASPGA